MARFQGAQVTMHGVSGILSSAFAINGKDVSKQELIANLLTITAGRKTFIFGEWVTRRDSLASGEARGPFTVLPVSLNPDYASPGTQLVNQFYAN